MHLIFSKEESFGEGLIGFQLFDDAAEGNLRRRVTPSEIEEWKNNLLAQDESENDAPVASFCSVLCV